MAVPYTFGSATSSIPLSQLDSNFATAITLGNTAVYLGNTTTTLNALTLSNVTISSGNVTITSVTLTNANITGTTTLSGLTASTALALDASKNIVSVTNTGTGNNVLAASPSLTGTVTIATLNLTNALGTTYGGTGLTSFTANGVVYASSSSALATGSALTFDGTALSLAGALNSNVQNWSGAGTGFTLRVKANDGSASNSSAYRLYLDYLTGAATNGFIDFYRGGGGGDGYLAFGASGSEQMRLTSTGLGIGTSSPAYKLDVNGSAQLRGAGYLYLGNSDNTNSFYINNAGATGGNNASLVFNETNYGAVMTIQNGNLGLGVTPSSAPAGSLFVKRNIFGASTAPFCLYYNSTLNASETADTYINTGYASRYYQNAGAHYWNTAPSGTAGNAITFTQALTLDANGNLLCGTTSANNAPANGVQLWGSTAQTSSGGLIAVGHVSGAASGTQYQTFSYNGSIIGSITQSGTTGVLYNITSDQRLKDDLGAVTTTDVIANTVIHDFTWKSDGSQARGVFAQEAFEVIPSAVKVGDNSDEVTDTWQVDYSKYVPDIIVELQALRARIAELEAR